MSSVSFDPTEHPHRRFNPLIGKHVLISPHRTKRPWAGQTDAPVAKKLPKWEKTCYLCPGNERTGGDRNPEFEETYAFPNDFPALLPPPLPTLPSPSTPSSTDFFTSQPVSGSCKVLTYSPRHDLTLALMSVTEIQAVVKAWREVYVAEGQVIRNGKAEGEDMDVGCVSIFENRGGMMGASAPHPHGQVWSTSYIPEEPCTELSHLATHHTSTGHCLLCAYAQQEVERGDRVIAIDEEAGWVGVVPFWGVWPYEVMILPYKRHISDLTAMTEEETLGLAKVMKEVLVRYDNLFKTSFPYSMGIHQTPLPPLPTSSPNNRAHIHLHFYPPLLRSAEVRKFLVGFEMLGEAQRDLTPEQAAGRLRAVSGEVHYLEEGGV